MGNTSDTGRSRLGIRREAALTWDLSAEAAGKEVSAAQYHTAWQESSEKGRAQDSKALGRKSPILLNYRFC